MSVIGLLIGAGGLVALAFLCAFVWAVRTGQFDDTSSPPIRVLFDDGLGGVVMRPAPPAGNDPVLPTESRGDSDAHVRR